jgi:hypothetical protein
MVGNERRVVSTHADQLEQSIFLREPFHLFSVRILNLSPVDSFCRRAFNRRKPDSILKRPVGLQQHEVRASH